MTISEIQKRLYEMYRNHGDIEVAIQNGDYCGQRNIENVEFEG